jgi:uncharacterized protein (TIGR02453 family)
MFTKASLQFLRDLAAHNDRDWFEAHRETYEREVRGPLRALVEEMDVRLAAIAPEIVGDTKRSLFRIHRDVRFSRDKSPYKTHAACWFFHRAAGRSAAPHDNGGAAGLYFHLEPGGSISAGGLYRPPREALGKVRDALAESHRAFERALRGDFASRFGSPTGEFVLTRTPRGYPADHPAARWLRFASFTASRPMSDAEACDPKLPDRLTEDFAALVPMVRWLNGALGFRPAKAR